MYGGWTKYVVLWTNVLGFNWDVLTTFFRRIFEFNEFERKSTFKIMNLGGYVSELFFLYKLLNNDNEKNYSKNSIINLLDF